MLAHLDADGDIGIVDVNTKPRAALEDDAADLAGDLGRAEGKRFIGALCLDLEGLFVAQIVRNVLAGHRFDALHALFCHRSAADGDDAEYLAGGIEHAFQIRRFVLRLDEHRALGAVDLEMSVTRGADAQFLGELILKKAAVGALEDDLAIFTKQNFFDAHDCLPNCSQ